MQVSGRSKKKSGSSGLALADSSCASKGEESGKVEKELVRIREQISHAEFDLASRLSVHCIYSTFVPPISPMHSARSACHHSSQDQAAGENTAKPEWKKQPRNVEHSTLLSNLGRVEFCGGQS